jgi:hypothetical protein
VAGLRFVELLTGSRRHELTVDEHPGFGPRRGPVSQVDAGLGPFFDVVHLHLVQSDSAGRSTVNITVG